MDEREARLARSAYIAAVEDQLVVALQALEADPARVASLAGFDWVTAIPLNAT